MQYFVSIFDPNNLSQRMLFGLFFFGGTGCSSYDLDPNALSTRPFSEDSDTEYQDVVSAGTAQDTTSGTKKQGSFIASSFDGVLTENPPKRTQNAFHNWCYGEELLDFEFSVEELEMLDLINAYRHEINPNLPELSILPEASLVARLHSEEMANADVEFGHDGFEERVEVLAEILEFHSAAENVGYTQSRFSPLEITFEDWIQSPSHLQNIEGDFEWTGVGIYSEQWVDSEGKTQSEFYVTQIFLY
jgi:uncharacterized protein YkwD